MSIFQKISNILNNFEKVPSDGNQNEPAVSWLDDLYEDTKPQATPSEPTSAQKDYATALLLNAYGKAKPIQKHYPLYYSRECNLINPEAFHYQLINEGYLVPSPLSDLLGSLKSAELKQILQSTGSKASGKKDELINRILNEIPSQDIQHFFDNQTPLYSLSLKGARFVEKHRDYLTFHQYSNLGINVHEYEAAKDACHSDCCEEILIYIFTKKENDDMYNRFYHDALRQLYDAIGSRKNALQEFLIEKYFDLNYLSAMQWITDIINNYSNKKDAIKHVYEAQKDCNVITVDDATYFFNHMESYSPSMVHYAYSSYPLTNVIVSQNDFIRLLDDMSISNFFDAKSWNSYFLLQLRKYLNIK